MIYPSEWCQSQLPSFHKLPQSNPKQQLLYFFTSYFIPWKNSTKPVTTSFERVYSMGCPTVLSSLPWHPFVLHQELVTFAVIWIKYNNRIELTYNLDHCFNKKWFSSWELVIKGVLFPTLPQLLLILTWRPTSGAPQSWLAVACAQRRRRRRRTVLVYRVHLLYSTNLLWSIDTCQIRVSTDQYHVTISLAQV